MGIDQRQLAALTSHSLPTIQRMEACEGIIGHNIDTRVTLTGAPQGAGIELRGDETHSIGTGKRVRWKETNPNTEGQTPWTEGK